MSVIGYRFVSDGAFSEKQREMIMADSKVREVMNVLTDNEIRDVIRNKVGLYPRHSDYMTYTGKQRDGAGEDHLQ